MDLNDKIQFMEKNLSRQLDWIRAADTKIAPVIFITTSMLGATVAFLSRTPKIGGVTLLLATFCVIALIGTLYSMVMVNFPRIRRYDESAIFFEGIKHAGFDNFDRRARELTQEEYFQDLSRMCYNSALIASTKFRHVRRAMICLFSAIIPWVLLVYNVFHHFKLSALVGD